MMIDDFMPKGPNWAVDWQSIDAAFPWIRSLKGGRHDPIHHQEGDVWIHTRMVAEALASMPEWRSLPHDRRRIVFSAALLHDVEKPATAVALPDGRITNRGHSRRGAIRAREILWRMGVSPAERERICAIIESHQVPFWLAEKDDLQARRFVAGQSLTSGNDLLALMAEADMNGRICEDKQRPLDNIEFFREIAREHNCYGEPFPFADDFTRFAYFSRPDSSIDPRWTVPHAPGSPELILMSGLPASGKTTWLQENAPDLPFVSLDALRAEMDIDADANQGRVVQAAKELGRTHLRAGRPFAWDGTNVTTKTRRVIISLAADYGFATRIIAVEAPAREIVSRNAGRPGEVPMAAIEGMLRKWEHPQPIEAHALESAAFEIGNESSDRMRHGFAKIC